MPQQSHHKERDREQGKRGMGAEREGKGRGKQVERGERGRSNDDGRAKKKHPYKTPKHRARKHRSQQGEQAT